MWLAQSKQVVELEIDEHVGAISASDGMATALSMPLPAIIPRGPWLLCRKPCDKLRTSE